MNEQSIRDILAQGENTCVEFRVSKIRPESLAKELTAFSNGSGGVILFGVDDDGSIIGIKDDDNYEEWIANIARNNVSPEIHPAVEKIVLDKKKLILVTLEKGKDKPYQATDEKFYIRIGSTVRTASQQELMRLFQQAGVFHYDLIGLEHTSIANLNLHKIDEYFSRYEVSFEKESEPEKLLLLKNTDILSEEGLVLVAGMLIFGINPQKHLRSASVSFAHFMGKSISDELIDKQEIEGTLDSQIDRTFSIIKHNIFSPSKIVGTKREDTFVGFSDKLFRELITNCCVHRNYSIHGSKIRVFMFEDRIEFISPGRLPNTINIDKLKAGVSYSVNPVIVKFMENLKYIDRLGRGIPMVCNEAKKLNKKVIFEEIGEEFKVTLYL